MKRIIGLLIIGLFTLGQTGVAQAANATYTLSAIMPAATGVNISAYSQPAAGGAGTLITNSQFNFGTLTLDPTYGIYKSNVYFAIYVAATGGAGTPTTTVSYAEGQNPNSTTTGKGLGYKANMSFFKVIGTTESQAGSHAPRTLINLAAGKTIVPADLGGGYLKMYVAISDGSNTTANPGEPFTASDKAGTYTGTLYVTSTL